MNVNEVVSNHANEIPGQPLGARSRFTRLIMSIARNLRTTQFMRLVTALQMRDRLASALVAAGFWSAIERIR
ncbi:MAG: hypothetical protein KGM42_05660 [Hyphomicrobiales bacterium]|nr:hypothetical protein [Hyphomicrobiales bacterium]